MDKTHEIEIDTEAWMDAKIQFHLTFGFAMAEWANIERGFYYWFSWMAHLKSGVARSLFYGVRGFAARADMIEGVIPFAEAHSPAEISLIKEAIKKARTYSGFRNAIAHGEPIPFKVGDDPKNIKVVMSSPKTTGPGDESITVEQMTNATVNFAELAHILITWIPRWRESDARIEEHLARVLALPSLASDKSDPSSSAPESPPPEVPIRRDKKAYRAAEAAKKKRR